MSFRTEQVDTPAGVYTVELHTDNDSENPLTEWDHTGMAFYVVGNRDGVVTNTLSDADKAGDAIHTWVTAERSAEEIERRFARWTAITGSPWRLFTGHDFNSYQSYGWFVLVDTSETYVASDGNSYPSLPNPESVARGSMSDYRTWAAGEVVGFVTTSPDGNVVESVWGFYDDDDALSEGRNAAVADAQIRVSAASLVGSGFMGLI